MGVKKAEWTQIFVFLLFLGVLAAALPLMPDKSFSPVENRLLAQAPSFGWDKLFSGRFMTEYEECITDQFPMRDGWTAMKAWAEKLWGKRENNGVYICADTLFERFDEPDDRRIDANLRAVEKFARSTDAPVYLALIPTAADIWREALPYGAPTCDQEALLTDIAGRTDLPMADMRAALMAHREEAVFYRTVHHWTSLGALYGADALLRAMGKEGVDPTMWTPQVVSDRFYGTLYSSSGARYIAPDSIEVYVPQEGVEVMSLEDGQWREGALYDFRRLEEKDQYSMFLGGNQPLAVIRTGRGGEKLLLIRDSYADSEAPFLMGSFSEIHLVDLRYWRQDAAEYVRREGIDRVAVSYSLKNFVSDTNIYFLGLAGGK